MSQTASYEELLALPIVSEHVVGPEHLDQNGHMNVGHYFTFGSHAMWRLTNDVGMGDTYITARDMTTFTAEQHIRYFAETHEGDDLAVASIAVDRGSRALHLASFILNRSRTELSCVVESMVVHVDFTSRRPVPFPDDIAESVDALIAAARIDAGLPISGALGIRR